MQKRPAAHSCPLKVFLYNFYFWFFPFQFLDFPCSIESTLSGFGWFYRYSGAWQQKLRTSTKEGEEYFGPGFARNNLVFWMLLKVTSHPLPRDKCFNLGQSAAAMSRKAKIDQKLRKQTCLSCSTKSTQGRVHFSLFKTMLSLRLEKMADQAKLKLNENIINGFKQRFRNSFSCP